MTEAYSEKRNPSAPFRSQTYDLPITGLDALPVSYRRLMGAYCKDLNVDVWHMCHGINVMVDFKPGE